ncbi:uncharacterized protein METZ01_LOCUS78489 [marine metagenome]|uniref:RagB/SusD domain-containing protein n=1 Tax=marine metagenome TaxID=408172 RepID=A0A381UBM7_9ZZZZ
MTNMTIRLRSTGKVTTVALSLAVLVGCDVTNPGPVLDEFLAVDASQQGLINGSIRSLAELVTYGAYTNALLAREVFPGGQTGAWGHNVTTQGGHILPGSYGNYWTDAVQARFIAETAIARFTDAGAPANKLYQAHLWAGYAYRVLGEWWCDAVIVSTDPSNTEPGVFESGTTTYFNRAVTNFSAALGLAANADEKSAALAGRAAAYAQLGDWTNAAGDASQVPDGFVFQIETGGEASFGGYMNHIYEAVEGALRSHTQDFTWFKDYYTTTGDPRVPWRDHPLYTLATASLSGFPGGSVPFHPQAKYMARTSPMNLASGWEMRLIEAEAALEAGNWTAAMVIINAVHTRNISDNDGNPLPQWVAADATEAWTFLKRERYIELWLEGRRASDERRWAANGTPGSLDTPDFESQSVLFSANPRSYCFDIPDAERDSNPNLPPAGG